MEANNFFGIDTEGTAGIMTDEEFDQMLAEAGLLPSSVLAQPPMQVPQETIPLFDSFAQPSNIFRPAGYAQSSVSDFIDPNPGPKPTKSKYLADEAKHNGGAYKSTKVKPPGAVPDNPGNSRDGDRPDANDQMPPPFDLPPKKRKYNRSIATKEWRLRQICPLRRPSSTLLNIRQSKS